jgi:hypothetical protein
MPFKAISHNVRTLILLSSVSLMDCSSVGRTYFGKRESEDVLAGPGSDQSSSTVSSDLSLRRSFAISLSSSISA